MAPKQPDRETTYMRFMAHAKQITDGKSDTLFELNSALRDFIADAYSSAVQTFDHPARKTIYHVDPARMDELKHMTAACYQANKAHVIRLAKNDDRDALRTFHDVTLYPLRGIPLYYPEILSLEFFRQFEDLVAPQNLFNAKHGTPEQQLGEIEEKFLAGMEDLRKTNQTLTTENNRLRKQAATHSDEMEKMREQLAELQTQLERTAAKVEDVTKKLTFERGRTRTLKKNLDEIYTQIEDAEEGMLKSTSELRELKTIVATRRQRQI